MALNLRRRRLVAAAALAGPVALFRPAILKAADSFPSRPIVMVNPYSPGGYVDNFARAISVPLGKALGQPINIVNTPGADGMLGHEYFLRQPTDGHVHLADSVNSIAQSILTQHAPYKMADFSMINLPVRDFSLMATSARNTKLKTVYDVVSALKADPTSLSIGLLPAQADYINLAILAKTVGIDLKQFRLVTYDDGGALRSAVVGGVVDFGMVGGLGYLTLLDQIRGLLAFANEKQPPFDAPCIKDINLGAPLDYVQGSLRGFGISTAFKTKYPDRYKIVVAAYQKVFQDPEVTKMLLSVKMGTGWFGPDDSNAAYLRTYDELSKYSHLLKGA